MRFLVLGSGGREHAIVRALKNSLSVSEVHASPGSRGISADAICHKVDLTDEKALTSFLKKYSYDCVVVGPETYLAAGVSDVIRAAGVPVVGPSQVAAQLEASKIFCKKFMLEAGVPTAHFEVVESVQATLDLAPQFTPPYVLKADGLAAGKGVVICKNIEELRAAAEDFFDKKVFGIAGSKALLEQFQPGYEISYLILTNGTDYQSLPLAQDHKRLGDGDTGLNTGGMGTVAPYKIDQKLQEQIRELVLEPSVKHLGGSGMLYRGVLFIGLMITPAGPQVLEYNVRFGDPETQSILPLLDGDWGVVFKALSEGTMMPLKWKPLNVACVVMAAPGYPETVEKDVVIEGDLNAQSASSYFLHAGTDKNHDGKWVTSGGRVLNAIGIGSSPQEAIRQAYAQSEKVRWRGLQKRTDIGKNWLSV